MYFHKVQIPRQTIKKRYNYLSDIYFTELPKNETGDRETVSSQSRCYRI